MLEKEPIVTLIDEAETDFKKCWEWLISLKNLDFSEESLKNILEFQSLLAKTLFKLDKKFISLSRSEKGLAQNSNYSKEEKKALRKKIKDYKEAIKGAMSVGKCLGDAFAWFFYRKEKKFLNEHLKHQEVFHIPTGIGGIGELVFIIEKKFLDNCLVIYHGTTTILRQGDFSLIDLKEFKLISIGEIKTKKVDDDKIEINLITLNSKSTEQGEEENSVEKFIKKIGLSENMEERLKRQIKSIKDSFSSYNKPIQEKLEVLAKLNFDKLEQLFDSLKSSEFSYKKIGCGLLLAGYKEENTKLSFQVFDRLKSNKTKIDDIKFDKLEEHVKKIVDRSSNENSCEIGTFHYGFSYRTYQVAGMLPFFWWPINNEAIKSIIFRETGIFTLFNQLHLSKQLKEIGVELVQNPKTKIFTLKKKLDEKRICEIYNGHYFVLLITQCLFDENSVANLIKSFIQRVEEMDITSNQKIQMLINGDLEHFLSS